MRQWEHPGQGVFAVVVSLFIALLAWGTTQVFALPHVYSLPLALSVALAFGVVIAAWPRRSKGDTATRSESPRYSVLDWARASADIDEALYWDLFENASDIVFTTDISGHFVTGNRAVERLLGYTVKEAQQLTWEKLVAPEDMHKAQQMFRRHARGERFINFELDVIVKSGEVRTFEIGSRPLFKEARLVGFHGIARDVTERKRIQEAAIEARREAEHASQAKSFFLANMSHEIRTPINGILGFLSLLSKTKLDREQQSYLQPIELSARNLLRIVDDILDLSKIEAGKITINRETIKISDVVRGAIELHRSLAKQKGLRLRCEIDKKIPAYLVGDGTRIAQVLGNLVNNATKFTEQGSVTVTARLLEQTSQNVRLQLLVRDTGTGIAPQSMRKLFEPFQQLEQPRDRPDSGSGLGLTITKNLVAAMGGELNVRSEQGAYTEVRVSLPLEKITTMETPDTVSVADFSALGLRVLVVDDNEINRRYLATLLQSLDIESLEAASGDDALEIIQTQNMDLVLMDLHMAGMDGIEATQRMRRLPRGRHIPVVAVSADVMGIGGTLERRGFAGFIAKPVQEQTLRRALATVLPHKSRTVANATNTQHFADDRVLDRARGIELASGDEQLWQRSLKMLSRNLTRDVATMQEMTDCEDVDALREQAHRLAGAAAYIGAEDLAQAARTLEADCQDRAEEKLTVRMSELREAMRRFFDRIKEQ